MNNEVEKKYVDPQNRNLDIVLIIIAVILTAATIILHFEYNQNELTKIKFKEEEFKNITWINELNEIEFKATDSKLTLIIDSSTVIDDAKYSLNKETGEVLINGESGKLYIRAVGNNSLTIWYNYAEYHLEKQRK